MATSNPYLKQFYATRRRLAVGLVVASSIGGGIMGAALTVLGKVVTGAPPATPGNYAWNVVVFGVIGAAVGPTVIWSALTRAPLWRTIVEPLAAGVAGAGLAVLTGWAAGILLLPPVLVAAAAGRLSYSYRERTPRLPSTAV